MHIAIKSLLPAGFKAHIAPYASDHRKRLNAIIDCFEEHKYHFITTPIAEFEDSFFSGNGISLKEYTFRLIDPVSNKMMAIRSDMTTQISRIASQILYKEPRPLRLCYAGEVLRSNANNPGDERQLTQLGIELIGKDSINADFEVIDVAIKALKKIGLTELSIDFSLPALLKILLEDIKFQGDKSAISTALNKKDIKQVETLLGKNSNIFVKLTTPGLTLSDLGKLSLSQKAKQELKRLKQLVIMVNDKLKNVSTTLDILENRSLGYYSGVSFAIFAKDVRTELGRGGRYVIDNGAKTKEEAVGFSLYANNIFKKTEIS